jgi:DNA-directed RNA polymerase specialized sigma24 family protein
MQAEEFFANEWDGVASRLKSRLATVGAPPSERDDLVQETATRLLGMWDRIDPARPVEALAQTIAVNAYRDLWRSRGRRELIGDVPDQVAPANTERAALARIELMEVSRALAELRPSIALTLREAVRESEGAVRVCGAVTPRQRMARTRARRALVECMVQPAPTVAA